MEGLGVGFKAFRALGISALQFHRIWYVGFGDFPSFKKPAVGIRILSVGFVICLIKPLS